ncbi:hypothetical protein Micbo1qcDRAFT_204818 [Microdochium bolleyi]|uniref:Uncharacterized protein n=1 Tax=Microdochium bolleyi TaxID=196109 RepID=A0A136J341_9PEZI|nr:hypothetical protein Micbo1qcDRAFT_204818 [Microdochium bolleyi]
MADSPAPASINEEPTCKTVLPRTIAVPTTFRLKIALSKAAPPTDMAIITGSAHRRFAALQARTSHDRQQYRALAQQLHGLLSQDGNIKASKDNDNENNYRDLNNDMVHPSSTTDSGRKNIPSLATLTTAALRLSERSQEVNRLVLQCCETRMRITRGRRRIDAISRTASRRQGDGIGSCEFVCELTGLSGGGQLSEKYRQTTPAGGEETCHRELPSVSGLSQESTDEVKESIDATAAAFQTEASAVGTSVQAEISVTTSKQHLQPAVPDGETSDAELNSQPLADRPATAHTTDLVKQQVGDDTHLRLEQNDQPQPYYSPSKPTTSFTDMLDINDPRYIAHPTDLASRKKLCRSVVMTDIPDSIDTLSAVLVRVRGGMVVRASLVDTSHWPAPLGRSTSASPPPCRRVMAYIEFADPREAHAYLEYVNDSENVDTRDLLFRGATAHADEDHEACRPQVQIRLADTPSYPLPAWLERVIQSEGASRHVVVRYQHHDDQHGSHQEAEQGRLATEIAAGEVVEKCMELIARRFLSSWPYREPTASAAGEAGRLRKERYTLLESAWIEQEFTPPPTPVQRDLVSAESQMTDLDPNLEKSDVVPGANEDATKADLNRDCRPECQATSTIYLHLAFCKIEHAIRAASALRYHVHAPASGTVTVGFAPDECAGDIDELQDIAAALRDHTNQKPDCPPPPCPEMVIPEAAGTAADRHDNRDEDEQSQRDQLQQMITDNRLSILHPWRAGFLGELLEDNFPGYTSPLRQGRRQLADTRAHLDDVTSQGEHAACTGDLLGLETAAAAEGSASSTAASSPSIWSTFATAAASPLETDTETEYSVTSSTPTSPLGLMEKTGQGVVAMAVMKKKEEAEEDLLLL